MSAVEETVAVVPDSIEPYVGLKYLSWIGGHLWSPSQDTVWPKLAPLKARCAADPREWALTRGRPYLPKQQVFDMHGVVIAESDLPGPSVAPPPGFNWSYERREHEVVSEDCTCGIYVTKDEPPSFYKRNSNSLLVEVAVWGRTIVGDEGARGQYAYPQRILTDNKAGREAAEAYGIPCVRTPDDPPAAATESRGNRLTLTWVWLAVAGLNAAVVAADNEWWTGYGVPNAALAAYAGWNARQQYEREGRL